MTGWDGIWLPATAAAAAAAAALVLVRRRGLVTYRGELLLVREEREVLLLMDPAARRLTLPGRALRFDEIPSRAIPALVEETAFFREGEYRFSPRFHLPVRKFDRIRDDVGPAFLLDRRGKRGKECLLFYVLEVAEGAENRGRNLFPYPEFYSLEEICRMDPDTIPPEEVQRVAEAVLLSWESV